MGVSDIRGGGVFYLRGEGITPSAEPRLGLELLGLLRQLQIPEMPRAEGLSDGVFKDYNPP